MVDKKPRGGRYALQSCTYEKNTHEQKKKGEVSLGQHYERRSDVFGLVCKRKKAINGTHIQSQMVGYCQRKDWLPDARKAASSAKTINKKKIKAKEKGSDWLALNREEKKKEYEGDQVKRSGLHREEGRCLFKNRDT